MTDPCLAPAPEIDLQMSGSPGALTARVVPSGVSSNGVELMDDGLYAPGYLDMLGNGFPGIPSPAPGDILVKTSPVANFAWTFRFNALSSAIYPWEFIGGAPWYDHQEGNGVVSAGGGGMSGWATLAATDVRGPSFAIPFNGVYVVEWGAAVNCAAGNEADMGVDTVASATPGAGSIARAVGTSGSNYVSVMRAQQLTLNSGDTLQSFYRGTADGSNNQFQNRWMKVTPIRCGGARAASTYGGT